MVVLVGLLFFWLCGEHEEEEGVKSMYTLRDCGRIN